MVLAAAICWSALPGYDCLLTMHPTTQSDCCNGMPPDCPMPDAGMSASCCSTHGQNSAVVADTFYSPEHPQKVFLAQHSKGLVEPETSGSVERTALETPPPKLITSIHSILRI